MDPKVIAGKLAVVADALEKARTAAGAAKLVSWSRAALYRYQHAAVAEQQSTVKSEFNRAEELPIR